MWRRSGALPRARDPLILADAGIGSLKDRLGHAKHWKSETTEIETIVKEDLDIVGPTAFAKYRLTKEFAINVSEMLDLVTDKLMPRDFERLEREGFREILELIQVRPS